MSERRSATARLRSARSAPYAYLILSGTLGALWAFGPSGIGCASPTETQALETPGPSARAPETQAVESDGANAQASEATVPGAQSSADKKRSASPKTRVLILTGNDYPGHKWRETTPVLKRQLQADPRLEVDVVEDPSFLASPKLAEYRAVVLHWMNWETPDPGPPARENIRAFVEKGGGLFLVHFACGAFQEWPEFRNLAGRSYDPKLRGHDPHGAFTVEIAKADHPITKGLKAFETVDELYTCLAGDRPIEILAVARSKVDGKDYPMAFAFTYGKGRVFHSPLGHDVKALEVEAVGELFRRGCAWAAGLTLLASSLGGSTTTPLSDGWRFLREDRDGAEAPDLDDSSWESVRLPHDWAISGPFDPEENGYAAKLPWRGVGWYRRSFDLDAADAGRRVLLDFDGVMAFPKVYVNGRLAGEWDYGYTPFRVDATPFVRFGARNVIAVRADTRRHGTRWYPGAGIYRKVTVTVCEPVHLARWGTFITTPEVSDARAKVRISAAVENHGASSVEVEAEFAILDPDGHSVATGRASGEVERGGSRELEGVLAVERPRRWDISSPSLYSAVVTLRSGGRELERTVVAFGIRTFRFTADDGFHLNGRRVELKGVNLHHDHGPLGTAFYPRAMERQLQILSEMGANALRTSHNPPAAEVLELCDRMGIVVWDEAFDKWDDKADRIRGEPIAEFAERHLRNLVLRDRNHPCVVVWSIGNEIADVESNRDGRSREHIEALRAIVLGCDPTRPVGMACYIPSAVGTRVLEPLDLTGWNYDRRYAPYRELFPDKPIIYSESASALSTRGFYELPLPEEKTDYSGRLQVDSYDLNAAPWADIPDVEFQLMERDRFVAGEFVWTGFDYLGEPTPFGREARSSYFGIVDLCGIPKDRYWLYRSVWRPDVTTVHVVPHWNWPDRVGKEVPVFVYTNGDSAELFLNGRSLGRRAKGQAPEGPVNYALGAAATSSSSQAEGERVPAKATDGDVNSRWCAATGRAGEWLEVDLGEARPLRQVTIEFEREAKNYGYEVKASGDGVEWRSIARKETSREPRYGGPRRAAHAVDVSARRLRVEISQLQGGAWASIRELGAYPDEDESPYYAPTYRYRLRWNGVAYEPGELRAVAYRGAERIGEAVVRTAGPPASLRLTPDRTDLEATGDDLCYVLVEVLDRKGTPCPLADDLVRFEVKGPAEIAGVGNGNPLSLEPFRADRRRLFYGKAMLILRAREGAGGEVRVTAAGGELPAAEAVLRIRAGR